MCQNKTTEAAQYYNKEEILQGLKQEIAAETAKMYNSRRPAAYHLAKVGLLNRLLLQAEQADFLTLSPKDTWLYCLRQDIYSYKLELLHVRYEGEKVANFQEIVFLEAKAKLLSAEEYGAVYNIGAGSVRQWIRRGKLPDALKVGTVWRISELSLPKGRGYDFRFYSWDRNSCTFEKDLAFLNDYDAVSLEQLVDGNFLINPRKRNSEGLLLNILPLSKDPQQTGLTMSAKEKEIFELQLIEHPLVTYQTMSLVLD